MLFDDLFAEAERQLSVCNSCRYCAGYCPVWPALELRTELERADVTHLANLCHDCQDCLTACMYSQPHEFDLNPPEVFALVREDTYHRYVWPNRNSASLKGWRPVVIGFLAVSALLVVLGLLSASSGVLSGGRSHSPYELVPHVVLVVLALVPSASTAAVMARAATAYWRDIDGTGRGLCDVAAWRRTARQAATLRHQTGGDEGCSYPDGEPSAVRRRLHHLVAYGFGLTLVSTASAWVLQTFMGQEPPYSWISVPVICGTVGGVVAATGCAGLLVLKRRAGPMQVTQTMRTADEALLWALLMLMISGLAVLTLRTTPMFAPALVVHLAAVIVAFALAPYTKFFHWVYRVLSIQHHNHEESVRRAEASH